MEKKVRVVLYATRLLVLLLISTKYNHIISNSMGVMACRRVLLQWRQLHNKESGSCLSCTRHTYWSSSSSLPNIIKLYQTVWELWPAQDFEFRGDNYITNMQHTYWSSSSFLPNIIKKCLRCQS